MLTHVESSRTMATGLSSGRILVVDDDPAAQATRLHEDIFDRNIVPSGSAAVLQYGIRLY
jgi:hypothetical protein